MRILIYGLSGSGKSTLANQLAPRLSFPVLNGDVIRAEANDWDFSYAGRALQMRRVHKIAANLDNVIIDLVCPKQEFRDFLEPDITIFMDTIVECQYEDTNKMFEIGTPTLIIKNWYYDIEEILNDIQNL